jgi:5,10-methenyltetrahydrofolate synthetase
MGQEKDQSEELEPGDCFSPPCSMHEFDPAYVGLPGGTAKPDENLKRWRKIERERLLAARMALNGQTREHHDRQIADSLYGAIGDPRGLTVSVYWPFKGEPDLRLWMDQVRSHGGRTALPVVVAKAQPLVFRLWSRGEPLERGVWNIPVPSRSVLAEPDIVIAPVVGFDRAGFRLGYGGGFYDRTLAALAKRPRIVGVGYQQAAIDTIYPQPFDIPMDMIVTEAGVMVPER